MTLTVLIDDRERAVEPHFKQFSASFPNISCQVKHLTTADYAIMRGSTLLVSVERKTWSDMAASFRDGRKENITKMLDLRRKTNCMLVMIIEGKPWLGMPPNVDFKVQRFSVKSIRAHLDHLQIRDNVHILQTKDQAATAYRLLEFAKNYSTIKPSEVPNVVISEEVKTVEQSDDAVSGKAQTAESQDMQLQDTESHITALTEPKAASDLQIKYKMWQSMPGVTNKIATMMIDAKINMLDFATGKITHDQIFAMKYPSGNIIGKHAKKLTGWQSKSDLAIQRKIIVAIPGVSNDAAEKLITEDRNIAQLADLDVDIIAKMQKTKKRKIGPKLAAKIKSCLAMIKA